MDLYYVYKVRGIAEKATETVGLLRKQLKYDLSNEEIGDVYFTLNNYHNKYGEIDSASIFLDSAAVYWSQLGDPDLDGVILNNRALIQIRAGDTAGAVESFFKIVSEPESYNAKAPAYHNLVTIIGWQGDFEKAHDIAVTARLWAEQNSKQEDLVRAYCDESTTLAELVRHEEAYEVLMKMDVLGDSLYSVKLSDALAEAQVRYDTEKQQAEIKATRTQRNLFIALAVTAGVALVVAVWFFAYRIRRKKEIAQERIKTLEKEKEVMSLQSMLYAQEEERQRIARDLHDSIGALLSAAKLHITNIVAEVQKLEELDFLRSTKEALDRANSEVRRVAHDMMPGVLMKLGLMEGIEDFFDRVRASSNLKITFDYKEPTERLDTKKEVMIYRIIQELVNNTIKHAEASEILMTIRDQGDQWIMNHVDDGKGFDVSKIDDATSFGLSGLRSRVNFLQGSFDVDSKPGEGVRFGFEFPA